MNKGQIEEQSNLVTVPSQSTSPDEITVSVLLVCICHIGFWIFGQYCTFDECVLFLASHWFRGVSKGIMGNSPPPWQTKLLHAFLLWFLNWQSLIFKIRNFLVLYLKYRIGASTLPFYSPLPGCCLYASVFQTPVFWRILHLVSFPSSSPQSCSCNQSLPTCI